MGKSKAKGDIWCGFCPVSDLKPHEYPAHAKTNTPGVPFGKLPPTGRSMAMQSGVGEPTVWEKAEKLLGTKQKLDPETRCGYERFTQKRNRPWNYFMPIVKPNGESVLIEDNLTPMTRWVLSYSWLQRGYYPCCDPKNPAGSGNAKIIRRDGFLYPKPRKENEGVCPKDCEYCDRSKRCEKCPHPVPSEKCPKSQKDKCKEIQYEGDKLRSKIYKNTNNEA